VTRVLVVEDLISSRQQRAKPVMAFHQSEQRILVQRHQSSHGSGSPAVPPADTSMASKRIAA
jgi:hypothetical protein